MTEVEQQFSITQDQARKLLASAENVQTTELEETYYDTKDFFFLKKDTWLRNRNNRFELKYRKPENQSIDGIEIYEEYSGEAEIKPALSIPEETSLTEYIKANLHPVIEISTERKSFELDGYHVDIDFTNFGYIVCEIERQAENDDSIEAAQKQILSLALQLGLSTEPARNKAKEYIFVTYPDLAQELVELGAL